MSTYVDDDLIPEGIWLRAARRVIDLAQTLYLQAKDLEPNEGISEQLLEDMFEALAAFRIVEALV